MASTAALEQELQNEQAAVSRLQEELSRLQAVQPTITQFVSDAKQDTKTLKKGYDQEKDWLGDAYRDYQSMKLHIDWGRTDYEKASDSIQDSLYDRIAELQNQIAQKQNNINGLWNSINALNNK